MRLSSGPARMVVATISGVLAAACSRDVAGPGASTPAPAVLVGPLVTDSAAYIGTSIGNGVVTVRIVATYQNTTGAPVSLDRCFQDTPYPIFSVNLVSPANSEGAAYDPIRACVGNDAPFVVAPGATRTDTLTLRGPQAFDETLGRSVGVLEGKFRLSYGGQLSNPFAITLEAGPVPAVSRDLTAAIQTDSLLVHVPAPTAFVTTIPPIHVTIHNPGADTSFINNCNGAVALLVQKQWGIPSGGMVPPDAWQTLWSPIVPTCVSAPIAIPPGGDYDTFADLDGGVPGSNVAPRFRAVSFPGVYRVEWTGIVGRDGLPVVRAARLSNAFAIVTTP